MALGLKNGKLVLVEDDATREASGLGIFSRRQAEALEKEAARKRRQTAIGLGRSSEEEIARIKAILARLSAAGTPSGRSATIATGAQGVNTVTSLTRRRTT